MQTTFILNDPVPRAKNKPCSTVSAHYLLTKPNREQKCYLHLAVLNQLINTVVYDAFSDYFPAENVGAINIIGMSSRSKLCIAPKKTSYIGHVECHTVRRCKLNTSYCAYGASDDNI